MTGMPLSDCIAMNKGWPAPIADPIGAAESTNPGIDPMGVMTA